MVPSIHVLSKTTTLFHAGWKVDKKANAHAGTCGKGGQFDAWMEGIYKKRGEPKMDWIEEHINTIVCGDSEVLIKKNTGRKHRFNCN